MDGLKYTMGAIPGGNTRRTYGAAFWDGTTWRADVGGNLLTCRWLDPIQPLQGGNIVVDITTDDRGQSTALVIGGYTDQPRPSTGTVTGMTTAGTATRILFTGQDGKSYAAERFVGSYLVGDIVLLDWAAGQPSIIGKVPAVAVTPPANVPKPPGGGDVTGTLRTAATKSDTFSPTLGGWGRWATSQRGGEDVYSGSYSGHTMHGSWFYGAGNTVLAGRTILAARFRLPQRLGVGGAGAATVHLYAHTSQNQPGGDVSRTVGPFDVSVAQNAPPQWVKLPESFHAVLLAGGGISISGDPYVGFQGRLSKYQDKQDPDSGKTEIDWSN